MKRRLVVSYIALVIIVLGMLELPLGVLAARHERGQLEDQAQRDASNLAVLAGEVMEGGQPSDLIPLANRYRAQNGGDVVVVDASGTVLANSDRDSDDDAAGSGAVLVRAALDGRITGWYGSDEGSPWARGAAPIIAGNQPVGAVLIGIPAGSTEDRINDIWLALGFFAVGTIALTLVLALLLARSLTRPLAKLEAAVARFSSGRLETRADDRDGPVEIKALAAEFNSMAARLRELIEAQNRFVAEASHQLRSPLTALRLRLENLEAVKGGGSPEGIAAAGREVNRLSRIVDGLLALGRAGSVRPERRVVDVPTVVTERCDAWSALADERGITLAPEVGSTPRRNALLVPGDLEQILDNLLANAIDAVSGGGEVRVTVGSGDAGALEVHVIDDGPGMSEEDRGRAFDRFWQGPGAGPGRSGLGLAIVEQLALRNHAAVELDQAEPAGVDAVVVLPASARPKPEPADEAREAIDPLAVRRA